MRNVPPDEERCEAFRTETYYSDEPGKRYRCEFLAKFVIAGKRLCARHAGGVALAELAKDSKAVPIVRGGSCE